MTLEDLGNLGEFIAAVGVVVSFVFLAIQVRHNTSAIRDATEKDMTQHTAEFLSPIVESAEVAQILRTGMLDWDELDANDRMRFSMHLFLAFNFFQHLYSRHKQRKVDIEYWEGQREIMLWYLKQPGVRRWWSKSRSRLNKSFTQFLESESGMVSEGRH